MLHPLMSNFLAATDPDILLRGNGSRKRPRISARAGGSVKDIPAITDWTLADGK